MLGLDGLLAPNCILLVKWEQKVPRLRRDPSVEFILEGGGS
jgi:hypothetical protein